MEHNRSELLPLWIAAILSAAIGCYIMAYLYAGAVGPLGPGIVRTYRGQVLANVFGPAAIVETWIRGEPVYVGHN